MWKVTSWTQERWGTLSSCLSQAWPRLLCKPCLMAGTDNTPCMRWFIIVGCHGCSLSIMHMIPASAPPHCVFGQATGWLFHSFLRRPDLMSNMRPSQ